MVLLRLPLMVEGRLVKSLNFCGKTLCLVGLTGSWTLVGLTGGVTDGAVSPDGCS